MASWVMSVFSDRSATIMMALFKSMVRSKVEYCCPVWSPSKVGDIQEIEKIQRNFTRRINGCKTLNYWERLTKLKILSLQRRRERYMIIHVWKILHGHAPNDIGMEFQQQHRRGVKAIVPLFRNAAQKSVSTVYDNSFGIKAARLWNILPQDVNKQTDLGPFKVELGKFMDRYPDNPPVKGYATVNDNSLLEWSSQRGETSGGRT